MKRTRIFTFLFFTVAILNILGALFKIPLLSYIAKPLIVLLLIYMYIMVLERVNRRYVYALISCLFGDMFLLFKDNSLLFILGLISFLIAHVFFIKIVLRRIIKLDLNKIFATYFPFLILLGLFLFIIKDTLSIMFIPVLIYGMAIAMFATVSIYANQERRSIKSLYMMLGAIIFIISDTVLFINEFYQAAIIFDTLVIATYIIAQYLIYRSMILRKKYLY